jgi:hypothetical protein
MNSSHFTILKPNITLGGNMQGHHLILGELVDFITGETIRDTHDERYKQRLSRLLVELKGYSKKEIKPRRELRVSAGEKNAMIKIDFEINVSGKIDMIIRYGPGSLITRHRPALAASRLVAPYQIPMVVVTNGEDAEVIEGLTGKIIARGLELIPAKSELLQIVKKIGFDRISVKQAQMESRILYAFEIDDSCPCDDTVCRL